MATDTPREARTWLWLLLLTVAGLVLRLWQLGHTPLFADEAYYLLWSRNLAPGYYDHPAGVAVLLRLSTMFGGEREAGVRWLNALISTACAPLLYVVGRRYLSLLGAWIGAVAVAFGPVYVLTGRIVYPDSLQFFLLLLNLVIIHPLLRRKGRAIEWLAFGLTLGLLLNMKGTSLLYLGALELYTVLWRREWLREPGAWLGAGVTLLVFLPWLVWGAQHDWPSLRLAVHQGAGFGMGRATPLATIGHAWSYLTPPAAVLAAGAAIGALIGVIRLLRSAAPGTALRHPPLWFLLMVSSVCILLPMALSAANSPRNLALGLLPLWPLAALWRSPTQDGLTRLQRWLLLGLTVWLAVAGIGTVAALLGPTKLPRSSGAEFIREDAAGWPELADNPTMPQAGLLYAVDYSIAGQAAYYTGRMVHSSIGQFRYWGVPESDDWLVMAQGYIPADLVTKRLHQGFTHVSEPERLTLSDTGGGKAVTIWHATGRRVPTAQLMDDLDFLTLAREAAEKPD